MGLSANFRQSSVIGPRVPAIEAQAKLMESRNRYDGIHSTIVRSVQTQARSLFRSNAVPRMDIEDLEQELMLHVHRRLPDFDQTRASLPTFVDRIVRNHAATLIEVAKAEKRGSETETVWLNEPVVIDAHHGLSERSELIGDEHCLGRTPVLPRDEQIMLRHDLICVLHSLPAPVQDVFHWLAHSSISEPRAAWAFHAPHCTAGSFLHGHDVPPPVLRSIWAARQFLVCSGK